LFFNFALDYAIRKVQVNHDGLELNSSHRYPIYAGYVNILGRSVLNVKKNTVILVVASMEIGLEVNTDKN